MIRQAPRYLLRQPQQPILHSLRPYPRQTRFASDAPPASKQRSWKSLFVRAGLAAGVIYYYNTSRLFAEEPPYAIPLSQTAVEEESSFPTLDSLIAPRAAEAPVPTLTSQPYASSNATARTTASPSSALSPTPSPAPPPSSPPPQQTTPALPLASESEDPQDLEDSAHSEGAFNEETGEINWDCPCLGGMAHGPCGEQFRAAFSCFVYSKDEPKGMDCIDKFKEMQGCFREHPEEYGAELDDEEDLDGYDGTGVGEEAGQPPGLEAATTSPRQGEAGETTGQARYPSGELLPEAAKKGISAAENLSNTSSEPLGNPLPPQTSTITTPPPSPKPWTSTSNQTPSTRKSSDPTQRAKAAKSQMQAQQNTTEPTSESDSLVPKAAHDARIEDAKGEK